MTDSGVGSEVGVSTIDGGPDLVQLGFVVERRDEHFEAIAVRRGAEVVEAGGARGRALQCRDVERRGAHGGKS